MKEEEEHEEKKTEEEKRMKNKPILVFCWLKSLQMNNYGRIQFCVDGM